MNSQEKKWAVIIPNRIRRDIQRVDIGYQEKILGWLDALSEDPYKGDIEKVKGSTSIYRTRFGRYRCYFRIDIKQRELQILMFDIRSDIKDKTIQRLK